MSQKIKFFITDVFAEKKYSGNELATLLNCPSLKSSEMQQIAREINFSETTFILSDKPRKAGYDVRIFTPGGEVQFAGHPTLGTAFIIQQHIIRKPTEKVILNLKVGQVPVFFPKKKTEPSILWMEQKTPEIGQIFEPRILSQILSLNEDDFDTRFPIEEVSTGLAFIIVPLKSLDALKRAVVDKKLYWEFIKDTWGKCILVFCDGGYTKGQEIGVRVFADFYGVQEDPATGSANGCLAGYLVKNHYFQSSAIDIKAGQGYEIGRPSQLYLKAGEKDGRIHVRVGGKVIPIAQGWWG